MTFSKPCSRFVVTLFSAYLLLTVNADTVRGVQHRELEGSPKWYPTFDLAEEGCQNDALELLMMKRHEGYLFDTQRECCEAFYPWNVSGCIII